MRYFFTVTAAQLRVLPVCLILLAGPLAAQGLPEGNSEELGLSPTRLGRIDNLISAAIDDGEIAGAVALVARDGRVAYSKAFGMADSDESEPMKIDTLFRIASMTKPITSLAVMMLFEEGRFLLRDPIAKYISEFSDPQVLNSTSGSAGTQAAQADITIKQLLTHTSGISYGFMSNPVQREELARLYHDAGISDGFEDTDGVISNLSRQLGELPLLFEPGSEYAYGLSTDVLGHLVEAISGVTLAEFFETRIFGPLGMPDSRFYLDKDDVERLASVYTSAADGSIREVPEGLIEEGYLSYSVSYPYTGSRSYYSGGAGLISTAVDYARLLQMFLNGGELDGVRLLSRNTVELMTRNNIGELSVGPGIKFGLGFAIVDDPGLLGDLRSEGTYYWGGIFHTRFFVDPSEELIGVFMAQRSPRDPVTIRDRFINVVYQAIAN
jgi:CubicO group peptidase (beta-lactamase class C family)